MKNRWYKALAALLAVCICVAAFAACKEETSSAQTHTITVRTAGGMALEDIRVQVYTDGTQDDIVWAADTDEEGKTSFEAVGSDAMVAVLKNVPQGYNVSETYAVTVQDTVITLESMLLDGSDLSVYSFSLGDVMCDFTVSTGLMSDGDATSSTMDSYTLSTLLKEKKAVILNFWFENCDPCRMEFPYLQEAYEAYKDDVEVIAINPLDGTALSVMTYAANMKLTFPVVAGDAAWQSTMGLTAYPTTVVIDRYGMIAMMHRGAVTETGIFENIFDYFTSDDYVQTTIRNIRDLG